MNRYLPLCLSTVNRRCLIVGGGAVALRKIETLLDYETALTVIAPVVVEKISYLAQEGRVALLQRAYVSPEAAQYDLVIAAGDDAVNRQVHEDCSKARVPVNVVDNPALCDFIFPAVLNRDLLRVAISTDGKAPFLASQLRAIFESVFPDHWGKIGRVAAGFREKVRERYPTSQPKRAECYQRFLEADWKELLGRMNEVEIEAELNRLLEA